MINYSGLLNKLAEANITKTALGKELGISSRTIAKIGRNEKINSHVIQKIADYFHCSTDDICHEMSNNILLQALREEKNHHIIGGIYHELQIRMTYNSNHIEGSRLDESLTRMIFETRSFCSQEGIPIDDITETVNHFKAIDYVIDIAEEELTQDIIKELHKILKQGTYDSELNWYAVGDYKRRPNVVGGRETSKPKNVTRDMEKLLAEYNGLDQVKIQDIIDFHYHFERIHPFQDGNGRVGRLIALKECLKFGIVPFIIEDSKKWFYYRGLTEFDREPGYLTDTCLDGQDTFKRLLKMFEIDLD